MQKIDNHQNKVDKLIIMLHGLGSYGDDLLSLAPFFKDKLANYHCVSPNAIENYDMAPFGYQWFSLKDRDPKVIKARMQENISRIEELIKKNQHEFGVDNKDTILLGFSQGTMVSSYLALSAAQPYHAMIGFSGRLVAPDCNINKRTPICLVHGIDDEVVDSSESQRFQQYCHDNNVECELKLVNNLSHSIDASGLKFAIDFLKKRREEDE